MQFNLFLEKVKLYKKHIISFCIAFVVAIVGVFGYNYFTHSSLKVLASNFDFSYRKIPFDVGYIDFTLSQDLDRKTVIKENFVINPKIDWEVSLVWTNTIRYKFLQKLNIWDDLSITLKQSLKSTKWKMLDKEYNYIVSVIESPKVLKISPEWELDNLSQNIAVFFNIPMISLTSLEGRDKLPCPIEIEPKLDWICKWTTSSVLEYIPRDWFLWATKYKVTVSDKEWLLYKLGTSASVEITTPKLQYYVDTKFSAPDNIKIRFNFPVNLESLQDKLTLFEDWNKKDIYLNYDKTNESSVIVNIKWWVYKFDKPYVLKFDKGIMPKYGNEATKTETSKTTTSYPFLNNIIVYQNIFSWSKLSDTKDFQNNNFIPSKNVFFRMSFEEKIDLLDPKLFSFEDEKWNKVDFSLSYVREENQETKVISENKKIVNFTLKKNLETNSKYKLIVKKETNLNLEKDVIKEFITASNLEVRDYKFLSYSKSCVYLNNKIWWDIWTRTKDIIESTPESKVSSVSDYEFIDYYDQVAFWIVPSYDATDKKVDTSKITDSTYIEKWYCPPAKNGEYLYVINTRLNPNTSYKLNVKNTLDDEYWNTLFKAYEKDVKTWNIADKDKYLYISLNKEINLIPDHLPLVVNLQTINLDNIDIEACEMDSLSYIDYVNNRWNEWFIPKCSKNYLKNLKVNNNHWNLTNNKFDVEKDIIWWKTNSRFVLVRWYAGGKNQFSNIFIKGNLNVTLDSAKNKKLLFVTDFSWNLVSSLNLEFLKYDYESKTTVKVTPKFAINKSTWVYEITWEDDYNYIIVSNDKYFWIIDLNYNMFSDYDFKYVGWTATSDMNYMYLYTERPIYKPGDTVFIKGLLRKFEFNWYKKADIKDWKLEVLDSSFNVISTLDIKLDKNSNFNTEFIIPKESPLWEFSFRFKTKEEQYYKNDAHFYIEQYKKPDFKIDVTWFNKDYILWDKVAFDVLPKYYFGWNLVSTKWQYSVLTQNYFFDAKDYSNYQFGEWYEYFDCVYWGYCSYDDNLTDAKEFRVDENGKAKINYTFSGGEQKEKIYSFNIEVEDKDTKKTVNKTVSTIVHNTDTYAWVLVPYFNDKKTWIKAEFVSLDFDANPVSSKDLKVELIKREWKMVKKEWVDWVFYNDYALEETKESDTVLKTNNLWTAKKTIITKSSWEYMIKVTYTWANKKSFVSSSIVYVSGDDYVSWYSPNNDTTEIVSEKTQVLVGEKAYYTLKSPINTWKAMIVVEKDDWILDYFIHDIKSYWDRIIVPVKSTYYPNFYVRAFLIWSEKWNDLPVYKRALTSTKVSTEYKKLNISILKNKTSYKPWEKVWIEVVVKDSKWAPVAWANGSISIVDESLLALVGNPKKNPYVFFYDMKRYLGTLMYSSMINLIEKLEVKDITNGEKWWAWEQIKWWDSKKKRWVFKDTAFWQADFTTGRDGKIFIQSDVLPDNLTTWVVEILVNTPEDNKIWVAYDTFNTTKHVIINDNLPSFFWVGDLITLSPVVFNKTGRDADFELSIDATNVEVKGWNKRTLFIKSGESKSINFDIKVNDRERFRYINVASSKIDFKANVICDKNCSEENEDEIEKIVQILDSTTKESVATVWSTKDVSFDEVIDLWSLKDRIGQVKVNYGSTLFNNLVDSIQYLNNYPYWCSEQKTSSIIPNVYIKKLYDSVWMSFDLKTKMIDYYDFEDRVYKKKSLDQVAKEYIVDIRKFQKTDWWFVYWYDISSGYPNYSDFLLTSYILKSMSELENIGYKQEEKIMLDTVNYLKNRFYKNQIEGCVKSDTNDCKYSELDRLNAIESIQSYKVDDYEAYKMYKLLDIKLDDTTSILKKSIVVANLLKIKSLSEQEKTALKEEVKNDITKIINNELVYNPRWAYIWKTAQFTRVENTSLLLKVISLLWEKEITNSAFIIDNLNRWIISQKKNWSFWSTQDNISVIDAISNYMLTSEELKNINFEAKIKLNWDNVDEKVFNDKNKLESYSKYLDLWLLKDKNTLNIGKTGSWKIYYDLSMDYYLTSKDVESRDQWFAVIKEYYDYNNYNKIDSLKKEEWAQYVKWKISYNDLRYKKSTFEYLLKLTSFKVGQLVVVRNRIITPETRDKVAFEWFVPAGAELVNPNLATSSKAAFSFWNDIFEKKEYRLDRFFWYTNQLYSGIYDVSYLVRFTHAWEYYVKPSYINEFYNAEVFGRSGGEVIVVR